MCICIFVLTLLPSLISASPSQAVALRTTQLGHPRPNHHQIVHIEGIQIDHLK